MTATIYNEFEFDLLALPADRQYEVRTLRANAEREKVEVEDNGDIVIRLTSTGRRPVLDTVVVWIEVSGREVSYIAALGGGPGYGTTAFRALALLTHAA